ncbi:acetyl-CoA carboxylase biotin carboxyl carrier protein [Kitasatospora sp. NBC_01266]|uniref:acetyl-CoA carboxylase biotin carboxyl carrier protein n=1 Tax=Kitasatospora sp. NBC_01266 TaxID=2903572 RepID=UPI002E2F403E|nr:biotin/lipoyl-containing protein [Kitasatospora sp. NBC_01266]
MKPERAEWERRAGERREGDRRADGDADAPKPVRPLPSTGVALDEVCRNVARLAKATPVLPRRIRLQDGQTVVEIEWPEPAAGAAAPAPLIAVAGDEQAAGPDAEASDALSYVRAPMVGTFYHAGDPDAAPFVRVGDLVQAGQPVGVLEAMKMMNMITSEVGGRVVEVLTPNAHPVEFDQRLIALEPVAADGDPS